MQFALFAFDIGVELNQLAFIAALLGFYVLAKRIRPMVPFQGYVRRAAPHAIGIVASFWFLEQLAAFLM